MEKRDLKKNKKDFFNENEELETAKQHIWVGGSISEEETSKHTYMRDFSIPEKSLLLGGVLGGVLGGLLAGILSQKVTFEHAWTSEIDTLKHGKLVWGTFEEKEDIEQKNINQLIELLIKERARRIELENKLSESNQERLEIEKLYKSRYEQMIKDYNEKIDESNLVIDGLKEKITELSLNVEDLQLFVRTPSLTEEKMKSILAKYEVEEQNEEI